MEHTQAFERLELPRLANKRKPLVVAEAVLAAIRSGEFPPDSRLPSERALAEQFGVSRGAVREALSALQRAGAIRVRTGEGSFVCRLDGGETNAAQAMRMFEQNDSPLELWEARRELEFTLARLAASVADATDRRAVAERLEEMKAAAERQDLPAYLAANDAFHEALFAPVENSILRRLAVQLIRATDQLMTRDEVVSYLDEYLELSVAKHEAIRSAFAAGDADALERAILHHYDDLIRFYMND